MKILIIFNREPYDTTDVTWNGLRLMDKLLVPFADNSFDQALSVAAWCFTADWYKLDSFLP